MPAAVLPYTEMYGSTAAVTSRSAGIWYSFDNEATWAQLYNQGTRARQTDEINVPAGTTANNIVVMAFTDSHDDMIHLIYNIEAVADDNATSVGTRQTDAVVDTTTANPLAVDYAVTVDGI
jgi:hypothetical protein